jgi:hypothetical protein
MVKATHMNIFRFLSILLKKGKKHQLKPPVADDSSLRQAID